MTVKIARAIRGRQKAALLPNHLRHYPHYEANAVRKPPGLVPA